MVNHNMGLVVVLLGGVGLGGRAGFLIIVNALYKACYISDSLVPSGDTK